MERTEVLDMMSSLKLYRTRSAYDETLTTALKRKHEPQRFVGDLLKAEISEKQARSIKYQLIEPKGSMVMMKSIASGLLVLGLLTVQVSEANAAACAAGVYHAGCVGPRGAVVTGRPATVVHRAAVVAPHCYYRAGVRVCR